MKPKSICYVVKQQCFKQPKVADIIISFCIFVFLFKQITKKKYGDLKYDACVKKHCGQIKFICLFALLYADSKDCILIATT